MKITYRNLGLLSMSLFMGSILAIAYLLYDLPANISSHLETTDKMQLSHISSAVGKLSLAVGIGLTNGLLAILFLILNAKGQHTQQIVYVTQQQEQRHTGEQTSAKDEETQQQEQLKRIERVQQQVKAAVSKELRQSLEKALRAVCNELEACQGAVYVANEAEGKRFIELYAGYAFYLPESQQLKYEFGEGLAGQVAKEGRLLNLASVPDNYITVLSGLGKASPNHLLIAPIGNENEHDGSAVLGVIEIASFTAFSSREEELLQRAVVAISLLIREHAPSTASA